ncbi:MAG: phenylacetate--CoA ligase family protein, partial [Thermoguttaceae bacterium]
MQTTNDGTLVTTPELLSQDELRASQEKRLQNTISQVLKHNDYMRKKFAAVGVDPDMPGEKFSLSDIEKLPTISKADFRDTYPLGLGCVPKEEIREIHASSGSTGVPVVMPYTNSDLDQWAD